MKKAILLAAALTVLAFVPAKAQTGTAPSPAERAIVLERMYGSLQGMYQALQVRFTEIEARYAIQTEEVAKLKAELAKKPAEGK